MRMGYAVWGMRCFCFCSRNLYGCENSLAFSPATTFFTPSRFTLSRFFSRFTPSRFTLSRFFSRFTLSRFFSRFTPSRFTIKNLPYPSLRKRDFKLWKCLIYGIFCCSTALLLCCSTALLLYANFFTIRRLSDLRLHPPFTAF